MKTIKSFNIDFNWVNGTYAPQDSFAQSNAKEIAEWYKALGSDNFWTFAVSYNGCAWYDSEFSPKVKGLNGNFTKDCVTEGHKLGMSVFAYHCLAANPVVENEHPEWSRKNPDDLFNLIFCDEYIDLFCKMIKESAELCDYDGIVIDWFRCPAKRFELWEPKEKELFEIIMGSDFPGEKHLTEAIIAEFEKKSIERAWRKIKDTISCVGDIKIWTNQPFEKIDDPVWNGNILMKEADYLLNEGPDFELLDWIDRESGAHTQVVQNLCGWADHDLGLAGDIDRSRFGLFGFAAANPDTCFPFRATDSISDAWPNTDLAKINANNIDIMKRMFSLE